MTGVMFAMGDCCICGKLFTFNPIAVPSTTRFSGERDPVCEDCMTTVNARRIARGLDPFPILPNAYRATEEL